MSNDKEYMREYMKQRHKNIMSEIHIHLGGVCTDCGRTENLQVDHIDPATKNFTIGRFAGSKNKKDLWKEVDKCQLLCAECHEIKSITESGKQIAKGNHGTISTYRYCKCNECKEARNKHSREYKRERRRKRKEQNNMGLE